MKCMYSQGMISKRFEFIGRSSADLAPLIRTFGLLGQVEAGVFPLRWSYLIRTIGSYSRRWAEVWVYLQAAYWIYLRKLPGFRVEELMLRGSPRQARLAAPDGARAGLRPGKVSVS